MTFGKGTENSSGAFFVGNSYLKVLNEEGLSIVNMTFEAGCRNNWHIHHAVQGGGQILLVTQGKGWYQEWGGSGKKLETGRCGAHSRRSKALARCG